MCRDRCNEAACRHRLRENRRRPLPWSSRQQVCGVQRAIGDATLNVIRVRHVGSETDLRDRFCDCVRSDGEQGILGGASCRDHAIAHRKSLDNRRDVRRREASRPESSSRSSSPRHRDADGSSASSQRTGIEIRVFENSRRACPRMLRATFLRHTSGRQGMPRDCCSQSLKGHRRLPCPWDRATIRAWAATQHRISSAKPCVAKRQPTSQATASGAPPRQGVSRSSARVAQRTA